MSDEGANSIVHIGLCLLCARLGSRAGLPPILSSASRCTNTGRSAAASPADTRTFWEALLATARLCRQGAALSGAGW
jgi:hypothetical protein